MVVSQKSIFQDISQADLFQKINDVCAAVESVTSTKELFEVSLPKVMALFGANRGSIFTLKGDGNDLVLEIAVGIFSARHLDEADTNTIFFAFHWFILSGQG